MKLYIFSCGYSVNIFIEFCKRLGGIDENYYSINKIFVIDFL